MASYKRTIEELEKKAVKWWPSELTKKEAATSIVPILLSTQDKFISILKLSKEKPTQVFEVLEAAKFPANLFLKHLVVLADFGGEQIQRLNLNFAELFPVQENSKHTCFEFFWHENKHTYCFTGLPIGGVLNNSKLGIDGNSLSSSQPLGDLKKDMMMILLFGSNAAEPSTAEILQKCEIGNLLGNDEQLERYVKQKYIWVSRITGGAKSNALGQVAQHYVIDFLKHALAKGYVVTPSGHLAGVTHTEGRTFTKFDIVVNKGPKAVAIEVSFQVTTNSVIERKAGQAKARYDMIKKTGNSIAYIIDGAGNFQRRSAVSTICQYSDCTVGFSDAEFQVLADFIKGVLE